MRLAYLCYWNVAREDGVTKKIRTQVDAWRAAGHEVEVAAVAPAGLRRRAAATTDAVHAVRRFRPDLLYVRYDLFLPQVALLARRLPTVVEVNSNDVAEWALRGRGPALYNRGSRRLLLGAAAGLVAVSRELAEAPEFARFGKPTAVIPNAIDADAVEPSPPPSNERPRVVFSGTSGQAWQGIDKVQLLARELPGVDFDVVGYRPERLPLPATPNLTAHGFLVRDEYAPLLARADAALGTLALHRKRMREASPLKVREYLLAGLPVVLAYEDTALAGVEDWYLLRLPNTEENALAHRDEIAAFVERVRGRRVPRSEVLGRISAAAAERERLAFLERIARGGGR